MRDVTHYVVQKDRGNGSGWQRQSLQKIGLSYVWIRKKVELKRRQQSEEEDVFSFSLRRCGMWYTGKM